MPTVPLAKPGTITAEFVEDSNVLSASGIVLSADSAASSALKMKVTRARFSHGTQIAETSGDDDSAPSFESNLWPTTQFVLQGYALAGATIGISSLNSANNGNWSLKVYKHGTSRFIQGKVAIGTVTEEWGRESPFVGLVVTGVITDTAFSSLEA
jgi:hypothetical protein